jgi:hypothetical protein
MELSYLGRKTRPRGFFGLLKAWLGNEAHLWLWDEKSLKAVLERQGFVDIRRCSFGDATDPRFREVEEKDRFDGCLAFECKK